MKGPGFLVVPLIAAGLAGCAVNGPILVTGDRSTTFDPNEYHRDASKGDILVLVRGGLPGVEQKTLEKYIVDRMQGADWSPHAHFTIAPGPDVARMYSFVMMMNGPKDVTAEALCANPQKSHPMVQPSKPGDVTLTAGLCRYTEEMTDVSGRVSGVNDLGDPRLHELIADSVHEMTRPINTDPFDHHNSDETTHTQ